MCQHTPLYTTTRSHAYVRMFVDAYERWFGHFLQGGATITTKLLKIAFFLPSFARFLCLYTINQKYQSLVIPDRNLTKSGCFKWENVVYMKSI